MSTALWLTIGTVAVVVLLLLIAWTVPFSSDILRQRLVATLSDRLESEVDLDGLQLRLLPRFHAEGFGLRIRHKGRSDVPPLIKVDRLTVDAAFPNLLRQHVSTVRLTGLEISIPPDRGSTNGLDEHNEEHNGTERSSKPSEPPRGGERMYVIDELTAIDARLVIIPSTNKTPPRIWQIHQLAMQSVSFDRAMPFDATLTNGIPPGEIRTQGSFGPWQPATPGATPVDGTFVFSNADLSVFKGISGMLSAHGEFGGSLGRLGVHGETDTPQFAVTVGDHPVPLHTDYHATVDGTNGNTLLDRIDASFLNTSLVAKGSVVATPGKKGRTVALDVVMDNARIEDVLRLAVRAPKAPMTGALKLRTTFVLPPGDRDVVDKLELNGQFNLATVKFTNIDVQEKINRLSRLSRGNALEAGRSSVVSDFSGRFGLAGGALALSTLTFNMPGTRVQLAGTYRLRPQILDFKGTLLMDAKISETQKGWKRFALKIIDPLFAKKGGDGSEIPIRIQGKRADPAFGLDARAMLKRGKK